MYNLILFIVGETPKSKKVVNDLIASLQSELGDRYRLKVIDLLKDPEIALQEGVIATPTLVKKSPEPTRRIIGDFSKKEIVFAQLGLANCL